MSASNNSTLVGNLTRDPELKFTKSGTAIAKFSLAVNHRWYNNSIDDWDEKPSFFDCVAWGKLGENIAESVAKGDRLIVSGRLDLQQWETEDGQKRSKVEVVVESAGPDLLWATAEPKRVESGSGGGGGRSRGGNSGGGSGRTSSKRRGRQDEEPAYNDDEEPF